MSSSSETESDSRPGHNGDVVLDEEAKDPDDAENYDSDLDLTKDVQPISSYVDDRDELFKQVLETLEPEGRLDALIPEILSVLPRLELEQLCLEHLQGMSAKKLRKIMEGLDINEVSEDEEDETSKSAQEPAPKWKPLQDGSASAEVENEESVPVAEGEENGISRSTSRSSSRSRSSSYSSASSSSRRKHKRHYRSRRDSRHRRHHHGGRRKHRHSRDRHHRRHHRKSETESEVEKEVDRVSVGAASTKSGTASVTAVPPAVPLVYDPTSNMMIPVLPTTATSSVPAATFPTSVAPFVSIAPGFVDSAFVAAGTGIALPTLPTMAGIPVVSSTGFPPTKKSQYDVSVEEEFESGAFSPPLEDRPVPIPKPAKVAKVEPSRVGITSRSNVQPPAELSLKKSEPIVKEQNGRESTPPPPGTDNMHFESGTNNGNLDEPAPPGTEILF